MFDIYVDDMPAGQTPHTVTLYAHHDLVDSVQPGDRCVMCCMCVGMCSVRVSFQYACILQVFIIILLCVN